MDTTLDHGGTTTENPTDADIARIMEGPRDNDFFLSLYRGEDDFMEVMIDAGELWVETEVEGRFVQARSHLDESTVKAMLVSFRDGTENWRDLALWKEPEPAKKTRPMDGPVPVIVGLSLLVPVCIGLALFTGKAGWVVVLFALALPGVIAAAAVFKLAEVKRASSWKKASGRVVRSELVTQTRQDKEVRVPRIEYEYAVGFHKFVGKRVNFAQVIAGAQAKEARARYPVGTAVQVHYNPAKPDESVIERELPPFVHAVWGLVAVMTAAILFGAWWFLVR
jgi:hypothetical protein